MMFLIVVLVVVALAVGIGGLIEGLLWLLLISVALLAAAVWFGWSKIRGATQTR